MYPEELKEEKLIHVLPSTKETKENNKIKQQTTNNKQQTTNNKQQTTTTKPMTFVFLFR
jgi:hypothetical protein